METKFLTLAEVLVLHEEMIRTIGGKYGVKDNKMLDSALAQPQITFGAEDFYPTVAEKAAALAFSLIQDHPFHDGNKRTGHAAMELFLDLNGYDFVDELDQQERIIFAVAGSKGEAPKLMGFEEDLENPNFGCFFKQQPKTPEEVEQAVMAMAVSYVDGLRYGGTDPAILHRLRELGMERNCDFLLLVSHL